MPKKKQDPKPAEIPAPATPEVRPGDVPEYPVLPEEDPDVIPDDDPFETPPNEVPPPGERPL